MRFRHPVIHTEELIVFFIQFGRQKFFDYFFTPFVNQLHSEIVCPSTCSCIHNHDANTVTMDVVKLCFVKSHHKS